MTLWEEAKQLFDAASAMEPSHRDAYLRQACQGSPDLLIEVQSLLHWSDDNDGFLETPAAHLAGMSPVVEHPLLGQHVGPWRIVAVIGHGGMGVVYKAERADAAFQRQAALKVVRRGPHAADIIQRFQRERETLAALDHPNIGRVLDG